MNALPTENNLTDQLHPPSTTPFATLAIMAKYWTPGRVKTRLGHSIGMSAAAELHRAFTLHLCERLAAAGDRRVLSIAPDSAVNLLEQEPTCDPWDILPQGDGDLGARMRRLIQTHLDCRETDPAAAPRRVIVIGADCPMISVEEIAIAVQKLETYDLVLGPANDGGYYLIGMNGPWTEPMGCLFESMPWSTAEVLAITKQRAARAKLSLAVLPPKEDIDTIECLDRLRADLENSPTQNPLDSVFADRIEAILRNSQSD
ncbi:2-phospho-L-lactate guanylyltransferase [Novipirellula galeiformis]|uniref:2-phospho-L-lactate guanylyltransferase n=1 Tax=Novipirellula galeiformis TaxID=2528004 RepID=A0A5C6CPU1_9BACT|nr:TIGR04282 family arsenosugar biosynthesis glycosyltransferase [Novipirellula galeiformis]TWU26560.1 2-phospho-L-lactate guanylyltransferase [Novipirellula galeiformis]